MSLVVEPPSPIVVVADSDAEIRDTVSGFIAARGYRVEPAADGDTASALLLENRVAVLISDLAMRGLGGVELLSFARTSAPATRSIGIAANASARERDAALRLGAVRVLAKPLSLLELADAVGLANDCAQGFHGWLHRMSLVDVLQMYHHAAQSLVLHVRGDLDGAITFRNGELIHAERGALTGMPALIELLGAQRGQLETSALVDSTATITGRFEHVLLDGLRCLDEGRTVARPATHDLLDHDALVHWLAEHAPGAGVWRIHVNSSTVERLDTMGTHPETELAGTPGSIGWAYELAEVADPTWTRVELTSGSIAIALVRVRGIVLAFARLVTNESVRRRFHVESAQLVRWLVEHVRNAK